MTKYLVTMNSVGYGRFGDPRQELLCEEVDSSELYLFARRYGGDCGECGLGKPS